MDRFQCFHDACLRDASLVTETHIDADGGFNDDGRLDTTIVLVFQSQGPPDRAIELRVPGVTLFRSQPTADNRDSILSTAAIGPCRRRVPARPLLRRVTLIGEPNSWRTVASTRIPRRRPSTSRRHRWRGVPLDGWLGPVVRHRRVDA